MEGPRTEFDDPILARLGSILVARHHARFVDLDFALRDIAVRDAQSVSSEGRRPVKNLTGSIIGACSSRSGMCHARSSKRRIIGNNPGQAMVA
ncbi:MAG: hypothetical protein JWN85_2423 [Gammaproteobacteria bacterium]|nr:hypothetical protein [Gammaproteobacteria bacterium]